MNDTTISAGDDVTKRFDCIRGEEIKMMTAITRDPNPIHYDKRMIDSMGLPGLINQGASNLSYFVQAITELTASPPDLKDVEVQFKERVYAGDSLEATVTVDKIRTESDSRIGELLGTVQKNNGTIVLTGKATIKL
jgi:acyl dehydratase